jgi:hypothetical protein
MLVCCWVGKRSCSLPDSETRADIRRGLVANKGALTFRSSIQYRFDLLIFDDPKRNEPAIAGSI